VNEDWSGEPRVIGIDEDLWNDIHVHAGQRDINAERLLAQLREDLIEGDTIRLTRDGGITGYLRAERDGDEWRLVRS